MAISFYPKAGAVVECDFHGYIVPEIVKRRPVVIISPNHLVRPGLFTVVPLSTTAPFRVQDYHYQLIGNPIRGESKIVWAKCDLAATVSVERLDRIKLGGGDFWIGHVSMDQIREIRLRVARSIGVDPADPKTYTSHVSR